MRARIGYSTRRRFARWTGWWTWYHRNQVSVPYRKPFQVPYGADGWRLAAGILLADTNWTCYVLAGRGATSFRLTRECWTKELGIFILRVSAAKAEQELLKSRIADAVLLLNQYREQVAQVEIVGYELRPLHPATNPRQGYTPSEQDTAASPVPLRLWTLRYWHCSAITPTPDTSPRKFTPLSAVCWHPFAGR